MTTPPVVVLNKMFAGAISVNSVVLCLLIQLLDHPYPPTESITSFYWQGVAVGWRGLSSPPPFPGGNILFANRCQLLKRWVVVDGRMAECWIPQDPQGNWLQWVCMGQEACGMLNGLECFRMVDRITRSNSIRNTLCCCFYYLCLLGRSFVLVLLFRLGIAVVGSGICRWFSVGGGSFDGLPWVGGLHKNSCAKLYTLPHTHTHKYKASVCVLVVSLFIYFYDVSFLAFY